MLTRIRVRAALRAEARQRVFEQACFIMEALQRIINEPSAYQLPVATLLANMEQWMQDLMEQMGGLALEEEHDAHIQTAIWGSTGNWEDN